VAHSDPVKCGTSAAPERNGNMTKAINFTKPTLAALPVPQTGRYKRPSCNDFIKEIKAFSIINTETVLALILKRASSKLGE